jgi:uncharacterized protein
MLLVDVHGDLWPCHRWNKAAHGSWRVGSIYEEFSEEARQKLDVRNQVVHLAPDCRDCSAEMFCSGGCPAENLEASGDAYTPNENSCRITRILTRIGQDVYRQLYDEQNAEFMKMFSKPNAEG